MPDYEKLSKFLVTSTFPSFYFCHSDEGITRNVNKI